MSRSIGDKSAHELGVLSTPIYNSFNLYYDYDQFIVLASDGVWDVMENIEVINFIEKFRNSTQKDGSDFPAKVSNSSIARLLCEEARYRWFGVIEAEDVIIDDISCIILEINSVEPSKSKIPNNEVNIQERTINKFKSIAIENALNIVANNAARKDPTRGSTAVDKSAIELVLAELDSEDKPHNT